MSARYRNPLSQPATARPTWVTVGGLASLLVLSACRHTYLASLETDAAMDPLATEAGAESGAQLGADVSPEAGLEASPPDVPPEARPETGPEAGFVPDAQLTCTGICNAVTPSYPTVGPDRGQGNITMYTTEASSGGACNYGPTKVMFFVAVNVNSTPGDGLGQWQGGRACGQCVEVTAVTTRGPQSVVVRIMDKCPDGYCGMDLGGLAPAAIMPDGFGRYDGSWRWVSCAGHPEVSDGPTSLFVSSGANAYWSRVQVRNPPGAVLSMTWQDSQGASGTFPYATDPENTFEVPAQVLQSAAATTTVTARFSDDSSRAVALGPSALAAENTSYVMQ
jgi:hypothetical protein